MRKAKGVKISVIDGRAHVKTSDMRAHFAWMVEDLLGEYGEIVVERNGRPVARILPPAGQVVELMTPTIRKKNRSKSEAA